MIQIQPEPVRGERAHDVAVERQLRCVRIVSLCYRLFIKPLVVTAMV